MNRIAMAQTLVQIMNNLDNLGYFQESNELNEILIRLAGRRSKMSPQNLINTLNAKKHNMSLRDFKDLLENYGFAIEVIPNGHMKIRNPDLPGWMLPTTKTHNRNLVNPSELPTIFAKIRELSIKAPKYFSTPGEEVIVEESPMIEETIPNYPDNWWEKFNKKNVV